MTTWPLDHPYPDFSGMACPDFPPGPRDTGQRMFPGLTESVPNFPCAIPGQDARRRCPRRGTSKRARRMHTMSTHHAHAIPAPPHHGTHGRARRPRRAAPTGTTSGTTRVRGPPRRREMRIHCVIIFSLESRIVLEAVAAHGVAGSPGQAEAKWSGRNEILPRNNLGRRRGARRDTFGRDTFGRNELRPSPGSPPRALPGPVSAASGAAMKQKTVKQKRTRSRFLPITCPSRSTSPCLARQDLHSRANNGFARHATHDPCEARATRPTPIKTASGRPSPGF